MGIVLSPMKFKTFTWPHNPETYSISYQKRVAKHSYININQEELEDMGMEARVMKGSGCFFGTNAYLTFQVLADIFYDKTPGILHHPIWSNAKVIFTSLELRNQPIPNYVEYDFEFMEHTELDVIKEIKVTSSGNGPAPTASKGNSSTGTIIHVVKKGETLSGIAAKYGVAWKDIAKDNSKLIKNPNVLEVGWKLTINKATKKPGTTKANSNKNQTTGTGDKAYDRFMKEFGDKLGKEQL